jgi:NADPH-dependent curcumin reductase
MAADSYLPAVKLGEVMRSFAVGEVVASRDPHLGEGELIAGLLGWQDYALARAASPSAVRKVPEGVGVEHALSALGVNGLTAYFGLTEVGRVRAGETVVVSGAAGATGALACQIARLLGSTVIGIAGGPEKCRFLREVLKVEAAVDYRAEDLSKRLSVLCPKGVDVFFDNVGGAALDAALANLALHGRVVLCGAISRYNDTTLSPGPGYYTNLISRRGRMEGFIVLDYYDRAPAALEKLAGYLRAGALVDRFDVVEGLEHAPEALLRLFSGENQGKQLVKVAEPGRASRQ